jgi:hypothetical protein
LSKRVQNERMPQIGRKAKMLKYFIVAAVLVLVATQASAQDVKSGEPSHAARSSEAKVPDTSKIIVPLKVTVIFTEYDGEKKLSSLPYALFVKADENSRFIGRVRMGVKVPIWTGVKDSAVQYQDIGSNLDCSAQGAEDGKYMLDLSLERSSVYPSSSGKDEYPAASKPDDQPHTPLVRAFRTNLVLMLRDGQTTQNTIATDPLNGHIVNVEVTLNVVK